VGRRVHNSRAAFQDRLVVVRINRFKVLLRNGGYDCVIYHFDGFGVLSSRYENVWWPDCLVGVGGFFVDRMDK
jgi:hypothetical protein